MRILSTGTISTASSGNVTTAFSAVREKSGAQLPTSVTAYANFAYGSGGTSVDVYVQTSFDGGSTWVDIANFHFTTSAGKRMYTLVSTSVTSIVTPTDGSLSANTSLNGFLGPIYRAKWTSVGTYGGTTNLTVDLSFGEGAGPSGAAGAAGATGATGATGPAGSPGIVQLAQTVTSSSQATVDFTSISASYTTLVLQYVMADTQSGTGVVNVRMKVNNDGTSGNYQSTVYNISQNGSVTGNNIAPSSAGAFIGYSPQSGNTGMVGVGEITIVRYAATNWHKGILVHFGADYSTGVLGNFIGDLHFRWKNTAAINRLTFSTEGTAFADNSTFTLYGLP